MKSCLTTCFIAIFLVNCGSGGKGKTASTDKVLEDSAYVMKETLVLPPDTAMIKLVSGKRLNFREAISVKWIFVPIDAKQAEDPEWDENNSRQFPELIFFSDSQVVENPRNKMRIGKWEAIGSDGQIVLLLKFKSGQKRYAVRSITNNDLWLREKTPKGDSISIHYKSDAMVHANKVNDPFFPANLQWMLKPLKSETDSQIYNRTRDCIKFYALFYRDQLRRGNSSISFIGLPDIFQWYSGGIGLPEKKLVENSWRDCFYNKAQSEKAYDILRKLIVDNEFNWDKKAPSWAYQTWSVLEQMYWKMGETK